MNNGPTPEQHFLEQKLSIKKMCQDLNRKLLLQSQSTTPAEVENRPSITPAHRLAMEQHLETPIVKQPDAKRATLRRITPTIVSPAPVRSKPETVAIECLLNLQPSARHPKPFPTNQPPERPKMSVSPFAIKKN